MDPRDRFASTVEEYRRHRPDYPEALFDWIEDEASLRPESTVVDVGAGTGISSRQLAARGWDVLGVEPNDAMRAAAEADGGGVRYLDTDAETLAGVEGPVQSIVGGQAFHWVDLDRALPRFRELLAESGRVVAFWNLRDGDDPMMAAYEAILTTHCPEYASVGAEPRARQVAAHPGLGDQREETFPHGQTLDRSGLEGRVWSSSYVRSSGVDRAVLGAALDELFAAHQDGGVVRFVYRTLALSFRP